MKNVSKENIDKIYEFLNLPEDNDIDKADYLEFYKYFGNNPEYYKVFRKTKQDADVSWKDIRNLKWSDIDFANNTINFRYEVNNAQ